MNDRDLPFSIVRGINDRPMLLQEALSAVYAQKLNMQNFESPVIRLITFHLYDIKGDRTINGNLSIEKYSSQQQIRFRKYVTLLNSTCFVSFFLGIRIA